MYSLVFPYPCGVLPADVGCTRGHVRASDAAQRSRAVLSAMARREPQTLSELMHELRASNEFEFRYSRRSATPGQSWVPPGAGEALREGLTGRHAWHDGTSDEWLRRIASIGTQGRAQRRRTPSGQGRLDPWLFLDRGAVVTWPPRFRSLIAWHKVFTIPNRLARLAAGVKADGTVDEPVPRRCFCHRLEERFAESPTCLVDDGPAIDLRTAVEKICAPFCLSELYPEADFSEMDDADEVFMIRRNPPADFVARYLRRARDVADVPLTES